MAAMRPASGLRFAPSLARTGSGQVRPWAEMFHQAEEIRQLGGVHPFFVEGEDEVTLRGFKGVIAVFHAFGDAAKRHHRADIVQGEERREGFVGDFGINGHAA